MITAIIPTLNEEKRIGQIIEFLKTKQQITQILVIDDGSVDRTYSIAQECGAEVHYSTMLGKGASMVDGLELARNEVVLFLDGDIYGFAGDLVEKMTEPLLKNETDFIKGKFRRNAGRVTALTAKPLLKMLFPELAQIEQPLGGIISGRKELFQQIRFENDYGVDIGILIDMWQRGARIMEADVGFLEHDHQSLEALSSMSVQIVRVILERAGKYRKLNLNQLLNSTEMERQTRFELGNAAQKIESGKKMVLLDMDGTLIEGSFIAALTDFTGRKSALKGLWGNHELDAIERSRRIAKELKEIPKAVFEKVATSMPLKPFAQEAVVKLKKRGFQVGIITDSYYVASEIVRRRVFADFSIAHFLHFRNGLANGDLMISPLMLAASNGCSFHRLCKSNFLRNLKEMLSIEIPQVISVGNGPNDTCLFRQSDYSLAIHPDSEMVTESAKAEIGSLIEILNHLQGAHETAS